MAYEYEAEIYESFRLKDFFSVFFIHTSFHTHIGNMVE